MAIYRLASLFLFLLLFSLNGFGQVSFQGKSIMELKRTKLNTTDVFGSPATALLLNDYVDAPSLKIALEQATPSPIPSAYSFKDLGFFCKIEAKLEKAVQFPVKFRLGEVEQVDRKEGKWQFEPWQSVIK